MYSARKVCRADHFPLLGVASLLPLALINIINKNSMPQYGEALKIVYIVRGTPKMLQRCMWVACFGRYCS